MEPTFGSNKEVRRKLYLCDVGLSFTIVSCSFNAKNDWQQLEKLCYASMHQVRETTFKVKSSNVISTPGRPFPPSWIIIMILLNASELFIHTLCIQLNRITKLNKLKQGIFAQIPGKLVFKSATPQRLKFRNLSIWMLWVFLVLCVPFSSQRVQMFSFSVLFHWKYRNNTLSNTHTFYMFCEPTIFRTMIDTNSKPA